MMLARWGTFVCRRGWAVLLLSAGLVALSVVGILRGVSPNFNASPTGTESAAADQLITQQLRAQNARSLTLLYRSTSLTAGTPAFQAALLASVQPLRADSRVQSIVTPYDAGLAAASLVSRDQHEALAVVTVNDHAKPPSSTYY